MPGLGQLVLGAIIIVVGVGVACSIFLVICFVVVMLVFVFFAVVSFPVCSVAINIDSVVTVTIFVGVVSRAIFVSDEIGRVAVVVHGDGRWFILICDGTGRNGAGREKKG